MYLGTLIYTLLKGELVGTDEFGNRYYRSRGRKLQGRERRWVLYKGKADGSKAPAEWHAWLHYTVDEPLSEMATRSKPWQQGHQPNKTGTAQAYMPKGHGYQGGKRAATSADYQAWTPE